MTLGLFACKKTEKGESQRWESSQTAITQLSATYPGFKAALAEQRSNAEAAMTEAKKVEAKKARIEAMSKANNLLSGGFVGNLKGADKRIKDLRQEMVALAGDATAEDEKKVLAEAKLQVDKTLLAVDKSLSTGANDVAGAGAILSKVDADLKFAATTLEQVRKRVSDRKSAEQTATAEKSAGDKAATEAAAEAVAPWTCEYCSHENPHDATTCSNCKAARPTKK